MILLLFLVFASSDKLEEYKEFDKIGSIWPKISLGSETSSYKIFFMGINVGEMVNSIKKDNDKYLIKSNTKSFDKYRFIFSMTNNVEIFLNDLFLIEEFKEENISKKNTTKTVITYNDEYKKIREEKEEEETEKEEEQGLYPKYVQNVYTITYLLRNFPLKVGDAFKIAMHGRRIWQMEVYVVEGENIEIEDTKYDTIKVLVNFSGDDDFSTKSDDNVIWYVNDSTRKLVKMRSKLKVGHLTIELKDYTTD